MTQENDGISVISNDIYSDKTKRDKIIGFYQGVNRIIGENSRLTMMECTQLGVIGFCSTRRNIIGISLDAALKNTETYPQFMVGVKAINYHELGHYIFGVNNADENAEKLGIIRELNALNDCRDECFFAINYPKSKDYFRYLLVKFISDQPENFILFYGRRLYAPRKFLIAYEKSFIAKYGNDVCNKCKSIVDEFLKTNNIPKMQELALELKKLIPLPKTIVEGNGHDISKKKIPKATIVEITEELKKIDDECEETGLSPDDGAIKPLNDALKSEPMSDAITSEDSPSNLQMELDQEQKHLENILDVDISCDITAIGRMASAYTPPGEQKGSSVFFPSDAAKQTSKRMEKVLKEVFDDLGSRHTRYLLKGRIDVKSVMRDQRKSYSSARIFKQFEQNKQEIAKMGVVLLVDISGSMGESVNPDEKYIDYDDIKESERKITKAKEACWMLTTAMEKVGNRAAILAYRTADRTMVVKDFYRRGRWDYNAWGGTQSYEAYLWAEKMLKHLQVAEHLQNLMIINISDNRWIDEIKSEIIINRLNSERIIETVELCVGAEEEHGSKYIFHVKDYAVLPENLKTIMIEIQRNIASRARC